jgi:hypothetical protein
MRTWSLPLAALALLAAAPAWANTPSASTELEDAEGEEHPAEHAFDGLLSTGWAEGESGTGDGATLSLRLSRPTDVESVSIWPGNLSMGRRSLREYGRPRTLRITLSDGRDTTVTEEIRLQDGAKERVGPQRVDVELALEGARSLEIELVDSFEGGVFNHVFISEVALNFDEGPTPDAVDRIKSYEGSSAGERARKANYDEIVGLFGKIQEAQFGDRDALAEIMDRAGDGAPYLRRQLSRVPYGFRIQALPPDPTAIEALQKLGDSNAIPAFEMAALRTTGKVQRKYELQAEYFLAYQELQGGGDRNIPYWGQEGWEPGAFRSFGEPMGLDVDQFGDLHIADLGNHRIQRFRPEGRHDRIWGPEPDITNVWFDGIRPYYVAGSEPGEKPGQFVHPVDVDMIPGKEADGFAVLDAKGRVQLFDEQGNPTIGWTVRSNDTIRPNVGGEGYIEASKKRIVVVWGNEVFVYGLDSEELATWKTDDGVPNGVETLKNGKLAMVFGDEVIMYSVDGFRHGTILEADDIGPGIEDWDLFLDEKKRLWVVTDTGLLAKYKRPGKPEFEPLVISEVDLISPRIAVFDSIAYVLERDRILKVDALELLKKRELAEEEAAAAAEGGE